MVVSFAKYIDEYPPASEMWAFRMVGDRMRFFEKFIKGGSLRQLKPKHWEGGIGYRDRYDNAHLFFNYHHNLMENLMTREWAFNINISVDNLIPMIMPPNQAGKYFELIHKYDFKCCIDHHFVNTR